MRSFKEFPSWVEKQIEKSFLLFFLILMTMAALLGLFVFLTCYFDYWPLLILFLAGWGYNIHLFLGEDK